MKFPTHPKYRFGETYQLVALLLRPKLSIVFVEDQILLCGKCVQCVSPTCFTHYVSYNFCLTFRSQSEIPTSPPDPRDFIPKDLTLIFVTVWGILTGPPWVTPGVWGQITPRLLQSVLVVVPLSGSAHYLVVSNFVAIVTSGIPCRALLSRCM